jgi:hypothetical protein
MQLAWETSEVPSPLIIMRASSAPAAWRHGTLAMTNSRSQPQHQSSTRGWDKSGVTRHSGRLGMVHGVFQ